MIIEDETSDANGRQRNIPITGTPSFTNALIDPLVPRFAKELGQRMEFRYDWSKLTKASWITERVNFFNVKVEPIELNCRSTRYLWLNPIPCFVWSN